MNGQINKGVTLDSYEKLEGFINDISKRHCAKCKKRTYHINRGYDILSRWECLRCSKTWN